MASAGAFFGIQIILPIIVWSLINHFSGVMERNSKTQPESEFQRWWMFELPKAFIGVSVTTMITLGFKESKRSL